MLANQHWIGLDRGSACVFIGGGGAVGGVVRLSAGGDACRVIAGGVVGLTGGMIGNGVGGATVGVIGRSVWAIGGLVCRGRDGGGGMVAYLKDFEVVRGALAVL